MNYSDKLKDPRWQKKRLEIMQRDDFTCQFCGDNESTLHVHHYKYKGDPWEVDNKYLITLCSDCHEQEEQSMKTYKKNLLDELEGLQSSCYFDLLCIVHFLKENTNIPIDVSFDILSTCFTNYDDFFNNIVQKFYFENIKKVVK